MSDVVIQIVIICIALFFLMILVIKRFVYFRSSREFYESVQANFVNLYEGGIHAWFLPNPETTKVVLFCHGNEGNIFFKQEKIIKLHSLGTSVLAFDYSGYGRSQGVPNEQICYHNAGMYLEYLLRTFDKTNIILYGEGTGSAVASYTARRYGIRNLILESSIPSMKSFVSTKYPILKYISFFFPEFDMASYIKNFNGNILILHCLNDEVVPFTEIEKIAGDGCILTPMNGSHDFPIIPWNLIGEYIKK